MNQFHFIQRLGQGLEEMGLKSPSKEILEKLFHFHEILLKWNQKINLTAHRDPEESLEKNFLDSLVLTLHLPSPSSTILDIGSGAGFPGLVIKIVFPQTKITLIESDRRKGAFLSAVIRDLSLLETQVIMEYLDEGKVPSLGLKGYFDGAVSRATIPLEKLLPLVSLCLKSNGVFLGMVSSQKAWKGLELGPFQLSLEREENYRLPFSNFPRKILIFRKIGREK